MATRIRPAAAQLHEPDFYAGAKAQAELLRAGHYSDLDREHLIEEVDDLGESLKRSVRSRIRTSIEHLWKLSIRRRAIRARAGMTRSSPSAVTLRTNSRRVSGARSNPPWRSSTTARQTAAASLRKHGWDAGAEALPPTCPYTLDQITGDWLP